MRSDRLTLLVLALLLPWPGRAQFSGYLSAGYGYNTNPLYNYERLGDQLTQSYSEFGYTVSSPASHFRASYINGLMLFNRHTARNYLDHHLLLRYDNDFGVPDDAASDPEDDPPPFNENTPHGLQTALKLSARHDKEVFKEFDNYASELTGQYRLPVGDFSLSIENALGYRHYVYLDPLSNITDVLTVRLGNPPGKGWQYGIRAGAGLKHFTTSIYDTTEFENRRSFVLKQVGRGKGGAIFKRVPAEKGILVNAESDNILQLAAGLSGGLEWETGNVRTEFVYRRNPGLSSRYLAAYTEGATLNDDIYNDQFSYEGPAIQIQVRERLPLGIHAQFRLEHQRKRFGAPSLTLEGVETSPTRIDRRYEAELYAFRYFPLGGNLGLGLSLGIGFLRNESNDQYNDFSVFSISPSIGIGF